VLCQPPVSALVDKIGPRWLLGMGLVVWLLAQAAGGFVSTFGSFVVARIVLVIGRRRNSSQRHISNWFLARSSQI
jgi:MFS family permease